MEENFFLQPLLTQIRCDSTGDLAEDRRLVEASLRCNGALLDYSENLLDEETFLDTLEYHGHDMDLYLERAIRHFEAWGV